MTGESQPVPRHREIEDPLARRIIRLPSHPADGEGDQPEDEEPAGD